MVKITDARGLAYDFAKRRGPMWFTAKDVSAGAYVELALAQSAAAWLADMRLFDFNDQVWPRSYRINSNADQIVPELVREIENALEIILQRRKVEAKTRANHFAANNSRYAYQPGPPNRRHHHRNGPPPGAGQSGPAGGGPSGGTPNGGSGTGPQGPSGLFNMPAPGHQAPAGSPSNGGTAARSMHPEDGHRPGSQTPPPHGASDSIRPQSEPIDAANDTDSRRTTLSRSRNGTPAIPHDGRSKPDQLLSVVSDGDGASIDELVHTFHVQAHTMRAMISSLRKTRNVRIELVNGRYKVVGSGPVAALH